MAGNQLGAFRKTAKLLGIDFSVYMSKKSSGLKYCYGCKEWKANIEFCVDLSRGDGLQSLCKLCKYEKGYTRKKVQLNVEKRRAHRAVQMRVLRGKLKNPNEISCCDCGHIGNDRRHEYDHYNGYEGDAKFQVEAVCSLCHAQRHKQRNNG